MEFLSEYGMFLLKAITIVAAILLAVGGAVGIASKQKQSKGHLEIESLSDKMRDLEDHAKELVLSKDNYKKWQKSKKQQAKDEEKKEKPNLYVVDFKGSMDAHEVDGLRQEISAIITLAEDDDEVLVKVESGGGVVHGYGLAASQLQRLKDKNIPLTVSVDKVAASGGYMMACVAEKIIAAPFAIVGSIGVIAQMPNFNKLLKQNNVEFEQHTAGEFKRTLTMFGENTNAGRNKFREELEEVHHMFKDFVDSNRAEIQIDQVATGEYWYGSKAKELGLVDELSTSDQYLMDRLNDRNIFKVQFETKKKLAEKLANAASIAAQNIYGKIWQFSQRVF